MGSPNSGLAPIHADAVSVGAWETLSSADSKTLS